MASNNSLFNLLAVLIAVCTSAEFEAYIMVINWGNNSWINFNTTCVTGVLLY